MSETIIQLRRDLNSRWKSHNPILGMGEIGIETDTTSFRIGNGNKTWLELTRIPLEPLDDFLLL